MTIPATTSPAPQRETVTAHVYRLPVVRELPRPAADPASERGW
jgi:hypothetical protein